MYIYGLKNVRLLNKYSTVEKIKMNGYDDLSVCVCVCSLVTAPAILRLDGKIINFNAETSNSIQSKSNFLIFYQQNSYK